MEAYPLSPVEVRKRLSFFSLILLQYTYKRYNVWQPIVFAAVRCKDAVFTREKLYCAFMAVCKRYPLFRAIVGDKRQRSLLVPAVPIEPLPLDVVSPSLRETAWASATHRAKSVWSSSDFRTWEAEAHVEEGSRCCWLVIQWHHSGMDGRSSVTVLRDICRVLVYGEHVLGSSLPIPLSFVERFPQLRIADPPEAEWENVGIDAALTRNAASCAVLLHHATLSYEETSAFRSACRAAGVAVTAGLAAAFGAASPAERLYSFFPVDLRRGEADNLCFAVGNALVTELIPLAGRALWVIARDVHRGIKTAIGNGSHFAADVAGLLRLYGAPCPERHSLARPVMALAVSNVGCADEMLGQNERVTWEDIVPIGGNNIVPGAVVVYACTVAGQLRLVAVDVDPPTEPAEFKRLFDGALSLLRGSNI